MHAFSVLSCYAGLWTGDSTSSWEFVQMNIPLVLGIGLSAQPVSGCDIGGFCAAWQGQIVDPELMARWTIMGAFLPWFRNHYDNYYKPYQEPYRYEEPVPTICRKYIESRYKLIQYIYDATYENTQTNRENSIMMHVQMTSTAGGITVSRPTAWMISSFWVETMVAPIINPGSFKFVVAND